MHIHWGNTLYAFENQHRSSLNMRNFAELLIFAFWSFLRPFFKLEQWNLVQLADLTHLLTEVPGFVIIKKIPFLLNIWCISSYAKTLWNCEFFIVRRAGLLWSQQDFEWRWSVPLFKCLTVLEFSFILFDLCLLITFFNFIMNYVPIVTFWIFTYHKIWILSIMFCSIWSYWIIYFLACLEVSWRVVS